MKNPLFEKYNTAPFSKIENKHFLPAISTLITITKAEIDKITSNSEAPTFKNTVEALENTGEKLARATSIFFNLNSAETNDEIQAIAQEVSPLLTEFSNDMLLNEALFERIKTVYKEKDELNLSAEQQMLLDKKYKSFSRNGANLSEEKKTELRKIDTELSKLSLTFGENILAETNKYELYITDLEDLSGLPEGVIEAAEQAAKEHGREEGWVFTLDHPSYVPFLTYADNRELRRKLAIAFGAKGFHNDKLDNQKNVL